MDLKEEDGRTDELKRSLQKYSPDPYEKLTSYIRKAREIEKSFTILEQEEVDDFAFFNEKFHQLTKLISKFIEMSRRTINSFDASQLNRLAESASWLKTLPISLWKIVEKNRKRILVENQEFINILLKDLVTRYSDPIADLMNSIRERKHILKEKTFVIATTKPFSISFRQTVENVIESTGLRQYRSLLDLLQIQRAELLRYLEMKNGDGLPKEDLLAVLWRSFDSVLLEEYFNSGDGKLDLLKAILSNRKNPNVQKVLFTMTLFNQDRARIEQLNSERMEEEIKAKNYSEGDRQIILRCLTLHLYNEGIKQYAVEELDLRSLWTLVSFEHYPVSSSYEVGKKIFKERDADYQKILFDLRYDDFENWLKGIKKDIIYIERFLLLFRESPIMLENEYHKRFVDAITRVASASGAVGSSMFRELLSTIYEAKIDLAIDKPPYNVSEMVCPGKGLGGSKK